MADNKSGRDKQAQDADQRQRERAIQEELKRMDEPEPPVDTSELASAVGSITGAEIRAVCTEAGMNAIRDGREAVKMGDFEDAYSELDDGEEETVAMSGPTAFA